VTAARAGHAVVLEGGSVTSPRGFVAGAVYCGIKTAGEGKLDLGLLASDRPATSAGMFTRSTVKGAPVLVSMRHARGGHARGVVVNSGRANVATGARGLRDAWEMCEMAARRAGTPTDEMLVGSTGVIGQYLPMDAIREGMARIELRADGGHDFARAIMTTDTYPKTFAVGFRAGRHEYRIGAVAKGSGMIHPDMATMFCFLTTDAPVEKMTLADSLRRAVHVSLNMISVDNDTSTSDTVAIFANGAGGGPHIARGSSASAAFDAALQYTLVKMAKLLARDGEGATKLIEVRVEGAGSENQARAAARTISASPLVKTAVHGNDPNWGRMFMAAGRSGAAVRMERASAWIGTVPVYDGTPLEYDERAASDELRREEVVLRIDLGAGSNSATAWGCDMTADYVHINSDYTT
jgi:glutamate N-acetyltransferase/amino-acid N-acetyltransferase